MNSNAYTILMIAVGVLVIYYLYNRVNEKQVAESIMKDSSMNRMVIEKCNATGMTFGQALCDMSNKISD